MKTWNLKIMAQKTAGKSVNGESIFQSAVEHHVEDLSTFQ
jgi:hypothetical protein